ncbi:hypothetical protein F5879DRAFT_928777 [Lentinula edodes]|nr:hypothetical protein HHX47_DHR4000232 [Lentinula edodes]KAJ3910474.1 hypothetical protein F5879DRAFT_928777 [Lentinula edodes]
MIPSLPFKMFLFFLSITSHHLLGVDASPISSLVVRDFPKSLFLGYSYVGKRNIYQDGHKTRFKFDKHGLNVQPSPSERETYQLLSSIDNEYYELKFRVSQDDFDTLNHIYADEQANVKKALHNHQMEDRNTIVVKPKFDTFGVPHSMKDLDFWLKASFYHLPNGEPLQIYVSVTPVAMATSREVADWSKWKGGIKDLPPHLASNLQ